MIRLKTKTAITHKDPTKMNGASKSSIVTLVIDRFVFDSLNGIEIPFQYIDGEGIILPTNWTSEVYRKSASEVLAMSIAINGQIGVSNNIIDRFWDEIKIVAINQMAETFEILTSDIEEA